MEINKAFQMAGISPWFLQSSMDIYYNSKLANRIHNGEYGIQYLDYKVLVQILIETEPELIKKA